MPIWQQLSLNKVPVASVIMWKRFIWYRFVIYSFDGYFLFSACNCDSVGGVSGGECEGKNDPPAGLVAGRCICKPNVEGQRCDRCKPGFWNLRRDDPDGCKGTCVKSFR